MSDARQEIGSEIELSIIAPMYNEEENVVSTFKAIKETMIGFSGSWELIFVNDGSTDGTMESAQKLVKENPELRLISYERNRGRGYALRQGYKKARGTFIVSIDFDLSYHPDHILKLYQELKNDDSVDAVLGSPYMPGGRTVGVPAKRLYISKLSNRFINFFFPGNISTSTCILRGYRREAITTLELESDDKEIHLEILSKLLTLGYRVKEIPATLEARKKGTSSFHFSSFIKSHLEYSLFERPALLFGIVGLFSVLLGIVIGFKLFIDYLQSDLNPERPLVNVGIVLLVAGIQILIFTVLTLQITGLRKEILRIQIENKEILRIQIENKEILSGIDGTNDPGGRDGRTGDEQTAGDTK